MLFTPLKRPLDLKGTSDLNRAVDERHFINSEPDRIFVPELGPFFKESMIVVDVLSGETLVEHEDYRLLHMVSTATNEANKEIDCVVYILNKTISEVLITYQAIGGIYAEGSIALLEIIERFKDAKLPPIYWATILNLPDTFPVTPHKHTIYDLVGLQSLISALTKVNDALLGRDIPKFQTLYDNLDKVIADLETKGGEYTQSLEQGFMRIESNMIYRKGTVKVTDNSNNPFDYLGYGSWSRLENVLLYGQAPGESTDPISNVSGDTGLISRVTNFWEQISDIDGVSLNLTASATSINEGQSVSFTLRTTGISEGALVPYKIDGVSAGDITTSLSGNFVINNEGIGTVTITTIEDNLSEGVESLGLYLENYTSIRRVVRINDTSRSPSFSVYFTADIEGQTLLNQVEEGSDFYIFIQSEFVEDGTVVNLFYTGSTTSNADFNNSLPSQLTISGGRAAYKLSVKADQLTESNEILFAGVSLSSADAVIASNVVTIRDTSRTPAYKITYSVNDLVVSPLTEISENVEFWCIIETENVLNGTVLNIQNAGTINDTDFDLIYPSAVTIQNNFAKFKMKLSADLNTEGMETLTISLMSGGISVYNKTVAVIDTSVNPNANMKFSTNSSGTNNINTANEGDIVYLIIATQNTPDGTNFNLIYSGSAEASDFSEGRPSSVTVNNNRAVVRYTVKADRSTEASTELMVISLQNQFTRETMGTVTLTIRDTSKASTYALRFSSNITGSDTITNANEGQVIYGIIETKDVDDNSVLFVDTTIGGLIASVANGDVAVSVQSSVVVVNNFATVKITLNNDIATEGPEILLMKIKSDADQVATASITINDTSKTPAYTARIVKGTASLLATAESPTATDLMINMNYALLIQTTNIPDDTVVYIRRNEAVESGTNYLSDAAFNLYRGVLPVSSVVIKNNQALVPFKIAMGWKDTAERNFVIAAYTSATGGSPVASASLVFKPPSYESYFAADEAGLTRVTAVDEGKSVYFVIKTTNVPDNSVLHAELFINNIAPTTTAAWNEEISGNPFIAYNILNNICSTKYDIVADELKEGNEPFKIVYGPYHPTQQEWTATSSITVVDTSYRANKIRGYVVDGSTAVWGNAIETFDPNLYSVFLTPENGNEGWTVNVDNANQRIAPNIYDRSGTSRVGYGGSNNIIAIDKRIGTNKLTSWQKSYHNEGFTQNYNVASTITVGGQPNDPIFVTPWAVHEAWNITRNDSSFTVGIFDRSGTNRIGYSGNVSITQMRGYMPHYSDHIDAPYPRIVMAGTTWDNWTINAYDMFRYNLGDKSKYAVLFCPEGSHEGWSLTRNANSIVPNIYNRSGQNRIGYSGRNSYAIIQLRQDDNLDPTNRYIFAHPGDRTFNFIKGRTYKVEVIGGGGAGGNAVYYHSGADMVRSGDGGQSALDIPGYLTMHSNGGIGGTRGNWNNGSAFHNGDSGTGGYAAVYTNANTGNVIKLHSSSINPGAAGWMDRYNAGAGGKNSMCPEINHFAGGGKGMYGSGDDQWGFGGSGGSGGYSIAVFKAHTDMTASMHVGAGGAPFNDPTEYYQANWHYGFGGWGQNGMIVITEVAEVTSASVEITINGTRSDSGFLVLEEQVDILSRATSALGRVPGSGDIITVTIPGNVVVLAPSRTSYAMVFAGFPVPVTIIVNSYGKILGRGGSIASSTAAADASGPGGTAIYSDGSSNITLNAIGGNGAILGGGGAGGEYGKGGSGAPYGEGHQYALASQLATLFVGGKGSSGGIGGRQGGNGGAPGQPGGMGRSSGYGDRPGYPAGAPFIGNNIAGVYYK